MTASLRFKKLDPQKSYKRRVVPTGTGEFLCFIMACALTLPCKPRALIMKTGVIVR